MNLNIDEYIEEAFKQRWFGDSVLSSLDNMKRQLFKNLNDQINGFWSGHTAYSIMIDYGFLVNEPHENGKRKRLTKLGEMFMCEYLITQTNSEAGL